jgi:hypothetical protein
MLPLPRNLPLIEGKRGGLNPSLHLGLADPRFKVTEEGRESTSLKSSSHEDLS